MKKLILTLSLCVPVLLSTGLVTAEEQTQNNSTTQELKQEENRIPQNKRETVEFNAVISNQTIEKTRTVEKEEKYTEKVEKTRMVEKQETYTEPVEKTRTVTKEETVTDIKQMDANVLYLVDGSSSRESRIDKTFDATKTYLDSLGNKVDVAINVYYEAKGKLSSYTKILDGDYGVDKLYEVVVKHFEKLPDNKSKIFIFESDFEDVRSGPGSGFEFKDRAENMKLLSDQLKEKGISVVYIIDPMYGDNHRQLDHTIRDAVSNHGVVIDYSDKDRNTLLDSLLSKVATTTKQIQVEEKYTENVTKTRTIQVPEKYFEDVTKTRIIKVPEKYTENKTVIERLRVSLDKTDDTGKFDSVVLKDSDGKIIDLKLTNNVGEFTPTKAGKHTIEYAVSSTGEKIVDFTITIKTTDKSLKGVQNVANKITRLESEKKGASLVYDLPKLETFITTFVDENDTEIKDKVIDTKSATNDAIDGYAFSHSEKTNDGTKHIYRKIVTPSKQNVKTLPKTGTQNVSNIVQLIGIMFTTIGGFIIKKYH